MGGLLFGGWTAEWPLAPAPILCLGRWRSPFTVLAPLFTSVPSLDLFPWQILLLGLAPFCLLWPGSFRKRARALDLAIAVSFLSIAATFGWGWLRGGSAYNAYYQLWRFLTALLVALLLHSVIRHPRHLRALGVTVVLAALVRGTLAIYFYWTFVY